MAKWIAFPHAADYQFNAASLKRHWLRLHAGDREPCPSQPDELQAWMLFHNGRFQEATQVGLEAGGSGVTAANKATCIYAAYLEPRESARLELFQQVAQRADQQALAQPDNPNAWYWQAFALGRYSQGITVAKALAQGLGTRVREALETTIRLEPQHADAHIALGAFHAEVIDKVGTLIGGMTYGAKKDVGMKLYLNALTLSPNSAFAMVEYANALLMMDGDKAREEATDWYRRAARCTPLDATERLDVEMAKAELST